MRNATAASVAVLLAVLATVGRAEDNCVTCHFGIEEMHSWQPLTCTECHGGNGKAETKEEAHVKPSRPQPNDERVLPLDFDPAYLRFRNPTDLRVVKDTCATCHQGACQDLERSLHGTTAGHLCDGMYECGIIRERGSKFAMFPVTAAAPDADAKAQSPAATLQRLAALPTFDAKLPLDRFETHYRDLAPKNCVRCHLWAPGVAVRGRLGLDGDYRSYGCAACHVTYADDGLSKSKNPTTDKFEPGHPITHEMTLAIPTTTCVHCHYGDASVGLNFRGLAQLYPGQPAGPEVKGTTDHRLNQAFYINDRKLIPPDVHHEKGMDCVDCHTNEDVMGDGNLYGQMPQAIEIECSDCHGTIDAITNLKTSRGRRIPNLKQDGGEIVLVSKLSGATHVVKQVAHVVNPRHKDYDERAAAAMTKDHARLECYACHAGWSPNFFGFHFERQEQFTQLDLMTGERTPGRVNTQEKVFATFRGLYLGWNSEGMVAPYMVGFSSMGSASGPDGKPLLDQEMPVTAAGLSGMTLIHHQLHTTRPAARECVDCHRNPTALGLGSTDNDFSLSRNFLFTGSAHGIDVFSISRKRLQDSTPVATLPLLGVRGMALECEPLQGHAVRAYASVAKQGVAVIDLANPAFPRQAALVKTDDPHGVCLAANRLYLADGAGGARIFDVTDPLHPAALSTVPSPDAREVKLAWPYLYIADHLSGLMIVDVTDAARPAVVARVDLNEQDPDPNEAHSIALWSAPSRPETARDAPAETGGARPPWQKAPAPRRTALRRFAAVACGTLGLTVIDVTDPKAPFALPSYRRLMQEGRRLGARGAVTSVVAGSHVDLGTQDGAIPTAENDYLYVGVDLPDQNQARLIVIRVTDPDKPAAVSNPKLGPHPSMVETLHVFNPPFLQDFVLVAGGSLLEVIDVNKSDMSQGAAQFGGLRGLTCVVAERMSFDRLIDESGRALKDISHEGARFFSRAEVDKILRADVPVPHVEPPSDDLPGRRRRRN